MHTGQAFLLLETAATIFMAGVLWTMQLLNYPLPALVGGEAFPRYEAAHNRRFALVIVLGVLAAAAGGTGLVAWRPGQVPLWDVPPGVHAMNAHHLVLPRRPATPDHGQRHWADPVPRRKLARERSA